MLPTLLSTLITCIACLVLGRAALRLCGWTGWSWLAPPVGLTVLMALASLAHVLPGRAVTAGVIAALAVVAAAVLLAREGRSTLRPPLLGLAYGLWPFALALVPFLVTGRTGILGVSLQNDMTQHILWVKGIMDQHVIDVSGFTETYPLGPHYVVAAIAATTGMPAEEAFTGFVIALPVLTGWTALAAVPGANWWRQWLVVAVCGMPYLLAAYFGESGFKELAMPLFVLAFAIALDDRRTAPADTPQASDRRRWIPAALIVAGMVAVYSYTGVAWPGLLLVFWIAGMVVLGVAARGAGFPRVAIATVRAEVVPVLLGLAAFAVVLGPQWPHVLRYARGLTGAGLIADNDIGNLAGRVSPWEALGMWDNADFRYAPADALTVGVWSGLVLALVVLGTVAWFRRGRWMVPVGAFAAWLLWVYADRNQSIYVGPKALAILAPILMLTAAGALVWPPRRTSLRGPALVVAPLLALLFAYKVNDASLLAQRHAPVGPLEHRDELRQLKPKITGPTLVLTLDEFTRPELAGKPVSYLAYGAPIFPVRPEKKWGPGQAVDIDTFPTDFVNTFDFVLTTKDAAASALPPQLKLVAQTKLFALYRRTGTIPPRQILPEGEGPAAVLDCRKNPADRRLSRRGGTATIREGAVAQYVQPLYSGADRTVEFPLPHKGTWDIVWSYVSGMPVNVSAPGMRPTEMPPNLDRPGPRYPVGSVTIDRAQKVPVRLQIDGHPLSSTNSPAVTTVMLAVPRDTERTVPLSKACGKAVDSYQPAR